jgi:hypothetical protein
VRSDIPTLILTNEFDDRTPTEHGRHIVASLGHAYLYELPGIGHAATPEGCFDMIALSFLRNPARSPDASCVAAMPRLRFETERLERPMLFFTINTTDAAWTPFAGEWDAPFANAPRPFHFSLTVANRKVTGSITAGGGALNVPVLEGTADPGTLMFKVKSPGGGRIITFTGTVEGNMISFQRDVLVPPGGKQGEMHYGEPTVPVPSRPDVLSKQTSSSDPFCALSSGRAQRAGACGRFLVSE